MTTVGDDNTTYKVMVEQGSTPASPAAGKQKLFIDSADHKLKRVNSAGAVTVIEGFDTAAIDATGTFKLSGDISPAQITSNQNDYNPTGLSTASVLRLNTDASRDITGLQGGADGRIIVLVNVGSFAIVLKDDDGATSTAANRFALSGDITLSADDGVILQYDSTSSRWRCIGKSPGGAGGGAPTNTPYITTAADAGLSAEKVLPYLANYNPDKAPGSPSASDDEFDDSSIGGGWTAVNTPDVASESTYPGFLHLEDNDAADAGYYEAFAPGAAAFSVAAKVNVALPGGFTFAGIKVTDSSNTGLCYIGLQNDNSANNGRAITGPTGGTTAAMGLGATETIYLLLTRDATTNYKTYLSVNGITWVRVGSFSQAGTVARLHVFVNGQGGNTCEADFDFVRTFTSETKVIGATP